MSTPIPDPDDVFPVQFRPHRRPRRSRTWVTQVAAPTSGYATASLIFGLATFITFGITGIVAVIIGHLALRETKTGQRSGHAMAVTGLILGYLAVAGWVVALAMLLADATFGGVPL